MIEDGVAPQAVAIYKEDESDGAFLNGDAVFYPLLALRLRAGRRPRGVRDQSRSRSASRSCRRRTASRQRHGRRPAAVHQRDHQNQDEAWEFIEWLTAPEQQKFRAIEGSYLPTRTALYDDPEIRESVPVVPLAEEALKNTRPAARLALLLGHVARDGRAVQRLPQRRRHPGAGRPGPSRRSWRSSSSRARRLEVAVRSRESGVNDRESIRPRGPKVSPGPPTKRWSWSRSTRTPAQALRRHARGQQGAR